VYFVEWSSHFSRFINYFYPNGRRPKERTPKQEKQQLLENVLRRLGQDPKNKAEKRPHAETDWQ
jgi:hypothetical protein